MLTLTDLTYHYPHQPMRFTFSVGRGERLAILGPSGAGKSTLLALIAGFLPASSGRLLLAGVDHTTSVPASRPVSMLFQQHNLFPHLSVAENIGLGLHPGLKLNLQQKRSVEQIAHQMGIEALLTRLPQALSGGQQQRAALARCLIRQQPILLLDEPFSALDPALRQEMLLLVQAVCAERDITLLLVSHHTEDAAHIAERVLLIVDGHLAWDGSTKTLLRGGTTAARVLGIRSP